MSNENLVKSLIEGHYWFLVKNTGDTNDPTVDHYVMNNEGVMSNNRHFLGWTRMETEPNGDGTTESQSLGILGYCHAYLATKDPKYLAMAEFIFNAYIEYFYAGQPIPTTPERYISNWICNSKQPVVSDWPISDVDGTHSGFLGTPLNFVNGLTQVPQGSPNWGEWMDVSIQAYDGALVWDAINASIVALEADGVTPNWGTDGVSYPVNWVICWDGNQVDYNGNILSSNNPVSSYGTVQLQDTTVQGTHLLAYAVRLPVSEGGVLIERNEVYTNRPVQSPLPPGIDQMGNSADSEQWFSDACYHLWKITGNIQYYNAMMASIYTVNEYTTIDSEDMYFRQSTSSNTPFTDGISYSFNYPDSLTNTFGRDANGYIVITTNEAGQVALEQQVVWFRVDSTNILLSTYGGVGVDGVTPVTAAIQMVLNDEKSDTTGTLYGTSLPVSTSYNPVGYSMPLSNLVALSDPSGNDYLMADLRAVTDYGNTTYSLVYVNGVLGTRDANVVQAILPDAESGLIIGFWLEASGLANPTALTYNSSAAIDVQVTDDNGWRWYWLLPATTGFVTAPLVQSAMILESYQPNHADTDPLPTAPVFSNIEQIIVILDQEPTTPQTFQYYCVNDVPPTFDGTGWYTIKYRITLDCDVAYTATMGNCTMSTFRTDSLNYCPGCIPFSNIYNVGSPQIGAWHGIPYPGYQYPFVFLWNPDDPTMPTKLNNMVDFLYDAQQWYYSQFGQLGPVASAYIWDRWDAVEYGPPNTWTMYNWGDEDAWPGYQPRAFMGGARAWYEMVLMGMTPPPKLVTYVNNWVSWLASWVQQYGPVMPTEFPMTSAPTGPTPDDFTGHMDGLWLGGMCYAALAGCTVPLMDQAIEACVTELLNNYLITPYPNNPMNGAWTPYASLQNDDGYYYGFWMGEIMRGLGMYLQYKKLPVGGNIYAS